MIEFKCSQCGEGMEAPQSLAGEMLECPKCGLPNRVPSLGAPDGLAPAGDPGRSVPPGYPSGADQDSTTYADAQDGPIPGVRAIMVQGRIVEYRTDDGWWFGSAEEAIAHLPRLGIEARRAAAKTGPKRQGECSRCGKAPRSLRETEGKRWVCLKCLSELYPALATKGKIQYLRHVGFTVPDELTDKECKRLWLLHYGRKVGLSLPDDTPLAELLRLDAEESLTQRAQSVLAAEHERHVTEEIERRSEYLPPVRHFYTKVAGVTYKNDDGSDRQEILSTWSPLQPLRVEHEDNNPHDPNAIRICTEDGRQIGYLSRDVASDVWWRMQHRFTYAAVSANIYGGTKDCPPLGMNILLLVGRPGVSLEEMQSYLDGISLEVQADVYDDRYDRKDGDADESEQE